MTQSKEEVSAEAIQAMHDTHAEFVDVSLSPHSCVTGKAVAELDLPREAVLVPIRRGRGIDYSACYSQIVAWVSTKNSQKLTRICTNYGPKL